MELAELYVNCCYAVAVAAACVAFIKFLFLRVEEL